MSVLRAVWRRGYYLIVESGIPVSSAMSPCRHLMFVAGPHSHWRRRQSTRSLAAVGYDVDSAAETHCVYALIRTTIGRNTYTRFSASGTPSLRCKHRKCPVLPSSSRFERSRQYRSTRSRCGRKWTTSASSTADRRMPQPTLPGGSNCHKAEPRPGLRFRVRAVTAARTNSAGHTSSSSTGITVHCRKKCRDCRASAAEFGRIGSGSRNLD